MAAKKCANPNCQAPFIPNKYNPDRHLYCGRSACKRYRDSVRQRRHYAHHCQAPEWREELAGRKHRERHRRKESKAGGVGRGGDACDPTVGLLVSQLLAGLAQFVSGAGDSGAVGAVLARCMAKGQEVFPDAESAQESPLGALFLTLVPAVFPELPHARSS